MFAAAAAAGAQLGSSWFSAKGVERTNKTNLKIARETNLANAANARELMGWQERMSNTAFQRSRDDMLAAGLNPILMAGAGGASTPAGSLGNQVTGAPMQNERPDLSRVVSSAIDAYRSSLEAKNLMDTNNNIRADTAVKKAQEDKVLWDAALTSASARSQITQGNILKEQLKGWRTEGAIDESKYGKVMRHLNRSAPIVNSASHLRHVFKPR